MNLKITRTILPLGCEFLSTVVKTVGSCYNPFGELGVNPLKTMYLMYVRTTHG